MMTKKIKHIIFIVLVGVCLCGCQPAGVSRQRELICPGKSSIEEAVTILMLQRRNQKPIRASAECVFIYKDDQGEEKKQAVDPVTVRFIPPDRIIFRGDEFGEVGFGANESEFWLRIKPDMDSYWWGTHRQADRCSEMMLINPYNVTEALGTVDVSSDWQLSYCNGDDILILLTDDGRLVKRVFVDACDYLVKRIEYFDSEGLLKAAADLSDYTAGEQGLIVPSTIEVTQYQYGIPEGSVEIRLKHIRPFIPTEKQKRLLFQRPERDGFEHLYRLNEHCEFVGE